MNKIQVAYTRSKNIKDILCRAKLYPVENRSSQRNKQGWYICGKKCIVCSHSNNMKSIKCTSTGEMHDIKQKLSCRDSSVIYIIQCTKCPRNNQYVGQTRQPFYNRMLNHRSDVFKSKDTAIGEHFSTRGHNTSHMKFYAIEKVIGDHFTLGQRERFYIQKFNTVYDGLNRNFTN
mgnify:CR=1 FL=1